MADLNQQQQVPTVQPPIPVQWTWIAQRQETDGKASSIWKFGFIAPDGAEVRVTFHQVGDVAGQQAAKQQEQQTQASQAMQMGMPPSTDPTAFAPAGQPQTDQTSDGTFYVTFFSNRHPEFFMRWDSSLSHDDSLIVWVTITHGIIDFVRKAQPANVILDDLANGKLKMVLRSVAMDVAGANPGYEIEQTKKHHYRSFYQLKKTGTVSAFDQNVAGSPQEGDTQAAQPGQAPPVTGGQAMVQAQMQQQQNPGGGQNPQPDANASLDSVTDDKGQDPSVPQPEQDDKPAFQSAEPLPIKQSVPLKRGLTVLIGKDYSIAVIDKTGNALDRYRAKNPADIMRWISEKGYGANKMKIVDKEQPSGDKQLAPERPEMQQKDADQWVISNNGTQQVENFVVNGSSVLVKLGMVASDAAVMNEIVNASVVRKADEGVEFVFDTNRDMPFKKALVELAAQKVGIMESDGAASARVAVRHLKSRGFSVHDEEGRPTIHAVKYPVKGPAHFVDVNRHSGEWKHTVGDKEKTGNKGHELKSHLDQQSLD